MSKRSASVKFIFITIFLDSLGIGLLIPVMPDVIRRFNTDSTFVNHYFGYFIAVYSLMQFLASPILGSLSDRFGRRIILLSSLLGAGLDYLLMAMAPTLPLLFLGRIISGLTGASMTVASSYMADISNDSNRSANFGMIGAGFGMGFVVGPMIGGLLSHYTSHLGFFGGPQAPFLVAALLNILNFLFGYFVLPESLPFNMRRKIEVKNLNPFRSLYKTMKPSNISLLVWVYALIQLAGQSHPSIWTLYTQYKFHWSSLDVGLSLTFVGLTIGIAQGVMPRVIVPKIGEWRALDIGLCFYVIGFTLFGLANKGWMMYAIMLIFCFTGMSLPALQSMISKQVSSKEQGELQGSLISIASFMSFLAPLLYTNLFAEFTKEKRNIIFPGAPYIAATAICAIALIMVIFKNDPSKHKRESLGR